MPARILAAVQSFQSRTTVSRAIDYKLVQEGITRILQGMGTYTGKNDPEYIQRHLSTNAIGNGTHRYHSNKLTKGLHGTPKGRVVRIEDMLALGIDKSNMFDESFISNNISIQGILIAICGSCDRDQVTDEGSLARKYSYS